MKQKTDHLLGTLSEQLSFLSGTPSPLSAQVDIKVENTNKAFRAKYSCLSVNKSVNDYGQELYELRVGVHKLLYWYMSAHIHVRRFCSVEWGRLTSDVKLVIIGPLPFSMLKVSNANTHILSSLLFS